MVWLKTSILGILILGSLGSLIAALLVYVVTKLVPTLIGKNKRIILSNKQVVQRAYQNGDHSLLLIFLVYHLGGQLAYLTFGMGFLTIGIVLTVVTYNELFGTSLLAVTAGIYLFFRAIYSTYYIQYAHDINVKKLIRLAGSEKQDVPDKKE